MELLNEYLSGIIMPAFLIALGIFFAFKLKFFYILHPIRTAKTILSNQKGGLKALSVALAGTLGVGNIVGVASAITMGGAGSIFWMWLSALCAMSLKYVEVRLAMQYRKRCNSTYYGGAPYYIRDGLKGNLGEKAALFLSFIFAVFCILNSLTTGNLVQINAVSSLLPCSPLIFGIAFAVLAFVATLGGVERISKITSALIPFLSLTYVILCFVIIFGNLSLVVPTFEMIFKDAFSIESASGGFVGFGISASIRYGVSRGVLSNEAGCGTSPTAHASSNSESPHAQGCLGVFEVFVDTILLCTLTALVILIAEPQSTGSAMNLVLTAFGKYMGRFGVTTVILLSISFAFATVICQYFYGTTALIYISSSNKTKSVFTFVFCLVLLVGAVIPMSLMWQISDLVLAVMTIINLACLFLLRKHI